MLYTLTQLRSFSEEAFKQLSIKAQTGDFDALINCGDCYCNDISDKFKDNPLAALRFYKDALETKPPDLSDFAKEIEEINQLCEKFLEVPLKIKVESTQNQLAPTEKEAESKSKLVLSKIYYAFGFIFFKGTVIEQSEEEANKFFKKASDLGLLEAHNVMVDCCHDKNETDARNLQRKMEYARLAITLPEGLINVADCSVEFYDAEGALKSYLEAAKQKWPMAHSRLGHWHSDSPYWKTALGQGDKKEAFESFNKKRELNPKKGMEKNLCRF